MPRHCPVHPGNVSAHVNPVPASVPLLLHLHCAPLCLHLQLPKSALGLANDLPYVGRGGVDPVPHVLLVRLGSVETSYFGSWAVVVKGSLTCLSFISLVGYHLNCVDFFVQLYLQLVDFFPLVLNIFQFFLVVND